MNIFSLKLKSNSDLLESLDDFATKNASFGYVLGVIGNLSKVVFKCPGKSKPYEFDGTLEIMSLNGTISPTKSHLHLSISDDKCKVWGGHLEKGTIVLKEVELLVGFLEKEYNIPSVSTNYSNTVDIYIIKSCPWSKRAIRMLNRSKIRHYIHTINNDEDYESLKSKTNFSTFPQIFVNNKFIGGYDNLVEIIKLNKL